MTRNGAKLVSYEGYYSSDVVAEKAYGFLNEALLHPKPWFLTVASIAPHSECHLKGEFHTLPLYYAPHHAHLFKACKTPRSATLNPEKHGGVGWIKAMPLLNDTVIEFSDEFQHLVFGHFSLSIR